MCSSDLYKIPWRSDISGVLRVDGATSAAQGFYMARFEKTGAPGPASPPRRDLPGTPVPETALGEAGCDPAGLPPGAVVRAFGEKAFVLPAGAAILPAGLRFQGFSLGTWRAGVLRPHARCRLLMAPWRPGAGLNETAFPYRGALGRPEPAGRRHADPSRALLRGPAPWAGHAEREPGSVVGSVIQGVFEGRTHAGK